MKSIVSFLLFLFVALPMGFAQPNIEEEIIPQNIRAATLEERALSQTLYYRDVDGNYKTFQAGQKRRGPINVQQKSNRFVLYRKGLDEEGNVIYGPAMSIAIPDVDNVLIVFYWNYEEKISYTAINDSIDAHPSKHARVMNLTGSQAKAQVSNNSGALTVGPNQAKLFANPVVSDSKYFNFAYVISEQSGSRTRPPINRWRLSNEEQRVLVFITYGFDVEEVNGELIYTRTPRVVNMFDRPPKSPSSANI